MRWLELCRRHTTKIAQRFIVGTGCGIGPKSRRDGLLLLCRGLWVADCISPSATPLFGSKSQRQRIANLPTQPRPKPRCSIFVISVTFCESPVLSAINRLSRQQECCGPHG